MLIGSEFQNKLSFFPIETLNEISTTKTAILTHQTSDSHKNQLKDTVKRHLFETLGNSQKKSIAYITIYLEWEGTYLEWIELHKERCDTVSRFINGREARYQGWLISIPYGIGTDSDCPWFFDASILIPDGLDFCIHDGIRFKRKGKINNLYLYEVC